MLAIAAARLGFDPVLALDNDPVSVAVARENAVDNGVEVEVERLDLRHETVPVRPTVTANLLRPLLLGAGPGHGLVPALPGLGG